jgi:hypothetical protein
MHNIVNIVNILQKVIIEKHNFIASEPTEEEKNIAYNLYLILQNKFMLNQESRYEEFLDYSDYDSDNDIDGENNFNDSNSYENDPEFEMITKNDRNLNKFSFEEMKQINDYSILSNGM